MTLSVYVGIHSELSRLNHSTFDSCSSLLLHSLQIIWLSLIDASRILSAVMTKHSGKVK